MYERVRRKNPPPGSRAMVQRFGRDYVSICMSIPDAVRAGSDEGPPIDSGSDARVNCMHSKNDSDVVGTKGKKKKKTYASRPLGLLTLLCRPSRRDLISRYRIRTQKKERKKKKLPLDANRLRHTNSASPVFSDISHGT